jgi:hypothetical protein
MQFAILPMQVEEGTVYSMLDPPAGFDVHPRWSSLTRTMRSTEVHSMGAELDSSGDRIMRAGAGDALRGNGSADTRLAGHTWRIEVGFGNPLPLTKNSRRIRAMSPRSASPSPPAFVPKAGGFAEITASLSNTQLQLSKRCERSAMCTASGAPRCALSAWLPLRSRARSATPDAETADESASQRSMRAFGIGALFADRICKRAKSFLLTAFNNHRMLKNALQGSLGQP